ncbi:MAG: hypothetical protein K2Q18_13970, partial [Bdellovibrionales bacterium]|nr:hypothetical protein [Bdellovibrionales bacterium]
MAQNHAIASTQLKDLLFTEDSIVGNGDERENIFELKDANHNSLGFISTHNLKTYILEHESELEGMSVRNIDSTDFTAIFEHVLFQRRRPQVIATMANIDSDQQFYILRQGQKTGPFQKGELITMLDEKEILLTDMVSYNGGHTWLKLYQLENFERRVLKESDSLPGVPTEAIAHSTDYVVGISEATEAISGLAYLSNVKRGKTVEREATQIFKADQIKKSSEFGFHKWLLLISFIGTGYFIYHLKNELASPFKEEAPPIGEQQAEVLTP